MVLGATLFIVICLQLVLSLYWFMVLCGVWLFCFTLDLRLGLLVYLVLIVIWRDVWCCFVGVTWLADLLVWYFYLVLFSLCV